MKTLTTVAAYVVTLVMLAGCVAPVGVLQAQIQSATPEAARPAIQRTDAVVRTHPSQGEVRDVEGASATLLTSEEGATAWLHTSGLEPGNVYTLWFVAINNPEACTETPCPSADVLGNSAVVESEVGYADGIIAETEEGFFAVHMPVGSLADGWFGNGFIHSQTAEIHLVINDHGPLIPEMASNMLNTYRGGCSDESLPPPFPDTAKADGEPGPNTCRLIQSAIFVQR
ncbi:MAG TPA: hypothetical protein VNK95_23845 [Caldilineaceae bacterium]|nr:hypothetical protein [Caldilineaceae bacterium]